MKRAAAGLIAFAWLAITAEAKAETILERVQRTHMLTCAGEPRPGLAREDATGHVTGLAADLCLTLARAIAGPSATATVTAPDSELDFKALAAGAADVMFLSGETITDHQLRDVVIPGPTVMIDPVTLMVPAAAAAQTPSDLAGKVICLMIGSPGQRALEATLSTLVPPVIRQSFSEEVELLDAYNVGRCDAAVGEASTLAVMRRSNGVNRLQSRLLSPPLSLVPIVAATPATDGAWASRIGGILQEQIARPGYALMPAR